MWFLRSELILKIQRYETEGGEMNPRYPGKIHSLKRLSAFLLCFALALAFMLPGTAWAEESRKVVRVGWYESAFHHTDEFGRKSGYGYEYQRRLSIYTGWTYEYVEGSWSQLLEKLIAGELDLLSDVSYTDERAEKILYSAEAMGSEGYHVFIAPGNKSISADDFSTLNGKKVGVNKNSIQEKLFIAWAKSHNVTPEIVESTEKTPVLLEMLANGEFDALVTLDTYGNSADVVPVCKVGFAESFFGINKNRPDLKQELDVAMNRLFEDNRDYNQQLTERFNKASTVNSFLTSEENEWLEQRGVIRVGYRDNFLPFCDLDDESGQLTGALSDFLSFAENSQRNAVLRFETRAFPTMEAALQALASHEIDCVFPLSISTYDGEQLGVISTDPIITSEMYAVVRTADHQGIERDRAMAVALATGHPSYETFVKDYFPKWNIVYYNDSESAFRDIASGKADCMLVSNYRLSRVNEQITKYKLSALATEGVMDVSFGMNWEDDALYSILNKVTRLSSDAMANSTLTKYGFLDEKVTLGNFLRANWAYLVAAAAVIAVIILLLVLKNVKNKAKAEEGQQIISEAERDPLTNLYNWNFFLVYANRLRREAPEKHMDAVVVNIDRFHSINALHGRDCGDQILKELGKAIQDFTDETGGIAGRSHADRFHIYCREGENWQALLDRLQAHMDSRFDKVSIHLRMGVKPWSEGMEPELQLTRPGLPAISCGAASSPRPWSMIPPWSSRKNGISGC